MRASFVAIADNSTVRADSVRRPRWTRRSVLAHIGAAAAMLQVPRCFAQPARRRFSVKDFHAMGDGIALDTAPIQHAIDAASSIGGGVVWFGPGRYITGTLLLKTGVTLDLAHDATLLGSTDPSDYRLLEPFVDAVGAARGYALIGCVDVHNVGITGAGVIDGRGAALQASGSKGPSARPFLLLCLRSTAVAIEGISLVNSSAWTMHVFQCSDVTVSHIRIRSVGLANNDGIDIDSSQRVHVEGCSIETGDDAICLKTTSSRPCKQITIKGCTMTTRCAAFKIGTESAGDFSAIRVSDCHVVEANLGAIKILSVDGANIHDVLVERMQVDDADTPIFLRLGARGRTFRPGDMERPPGTLSDVVIRNMDVKRARRIGILISGIPGHVIENVTLQQIAIRMSGELETQLPPQPAESPAAYPEVRMFGGNLPAFGIYGRHLRGLRMRQVAIAGIAGDTRPEQLLSDDRP
jgi:polygalacturonase